MPILEIELVTSASGSSLPAGLTQSLADEAAQIFGSPPGNTWVKVRVVSPQTYAEDGGTPSGVYPVFVTVLKSKVPEGSVLENEINCLTESVSRLCHRAKENVHIIYQPDGAGRVAFGGKLVR